MTGYEVVAGALYFLPVLLVAYFLAGITGRRTGVQDRGAEGVLATIALSIPVTLALDSVAILMCSWLVPLGVSVLVVRGSWLVGALGFGIARRRAIDWGGLLRLWRPLLGAVAIAAVGVAPFLETSRTLNAWDREWHVPLASSLQGQTLPFDNVFEPSRLRYHYLGDVVSAALRELSGNALTSVSALSLSHDLFLALAGGWLALLVLSLGRGRAVLAVVAGLGIMWHGPMLRTLNADYDGFAFHPFSRLSYRPHVPIAFFAMVAFTGAVALLAARSPRFEPLRSGSFRMRLLGSLRGPRGALLASIVLLSLTDETSAALFGLALGAAWLVNPRVLAERRVVGFVWLVVLALGLIVPNFVFTASLAPGGPVQKSLTHAPRLASITGQELPLSDRETQKLLLLVMAPVFLTVSASAVAFFRVRGRGRFAAFVFPLVVLVVGVVLGTCVTVNATSSESQRFFVAPFVAALTMAIVHVPAMRASQLRHLAMGLTGVALLVPAVYTLFYLPYQLRTTRGGSRSGSEMATPSNPFWPNDLYRTNCRTATRAPMRDLVEPVYVDETGYTTYLSCRSGRSVGYGISVWPMPIYPTIGSKKQLQGLLSDHAHPVQRALCNRRTANDAFCTRLKSSRECAAAGSLFVSCPFEPNEATEYLSSP